VSRLSPKEDTGTEKWWVNNVDRREGPWTEDEYMRCRNGGKLLASTESPAQNEFSSKVTLCPKFVKDVRLRRIQEYKQAQTGLTCTQMSNAKYSMVDDAYRHWDSKLEGWCKSHIHGLSRAVVGTFEGLLDHTMVHEVGILLPIPVDTPANLSKDDACYSCGWGWEPWHDPVDLPYR
jgi:hypothetical protein